MRSAHKLLKSVVLLCVVGCGRIDYRSHSHDAGSAEAGAGDAGDAATMDAINVADARVVVDARDGFDADDAGDGGLAMPAVVVSPTSGLTTTESGGSSSFTVSLSRPPSANVFVTWSTPDMDEVSFSPAFISFTTSNFASPQTVTLTGVDDDALDGDQAFLISSSATTSTDADFDGLAVDDVSGTNLDDETAGIIVTPILPLVTSESGTSATFTIELQSMPSAMVTIPITSADLGEGTASPAAAVFTASDWNSPQVITVTGVDDSIADGNQMYTVQTAAAVSVDAEYMGLDADDVVLTNQDDDMPGIVITPTSGLITVENGTTADVAAQLQVAPLANVVLDVMSTDETEGTVSVGVLTFTPVNWGIPQTVRLTGVDDVLLDGPQNYQVVFAVRADSDPAFVALAPVAADATNVDDERGQVLVMPTSGLATSEAGGTATFTMVLTDAPTADVSVALATSNSGEGEPSPLSVTFTSGNWNVPQTVTVTGVDDSLDDGTRAFTIVTGDASSADTNYNGVPVSDVAVSNLDDDTAAILVSPTSGLMTTEAGGTDTFTVVLATEPTASVVVSLSSSDIAKGSVSTPTLTFATTDWFIPRTVTVTGAGSAYLTGNSSYSIVTGAATSGDASYNGINPPDVSVMLIEPPCTTARFGASVNYATGARPYGVATADFNGDGNLDLVTSNGTANTASVLMGNGAGGFGAATDYAAGLSTYAVTVGDFNRDGKPDIATANVGGSVTVMLNTGTGMMGSITTYAAAVGQRDILAVDLNNDGALDLVTANQSDNSIHVLVGNGAGAFAAAVRYATDLSPYSVVSVDWNHDGRLDLATANLTNSTLSLLLNTGGATFGAPTTVSVPGGFAISVKAGEFTNDGYLDLVVAAGSGSVLSLIPGNAAGTLTVNSIGVTGGGPRQIALADFDGDGRTDLATANQGADTVSVRRSLADGTFAAAQHYAVGPTPYSLTTGDFNNDGHIDIAAPSIMADSIAILLGAGGFGSDGTFTVGAAITAPESAYAHDIADMDGDGNLDLLTVHNTSNIVRIRYGAGDGTVTAPVTTLTGAITQPGFVQAVDLDDNGRMDVAVTCGNTDGLRVHLNMGAGVFGTNELAAGDLPWNILSGDFNRDGRTDLAMPVTNGGGVSILLGTGGGALGAQTTYSGGGSPAYAALGDVNSDGRLDVLSTGSVANLYVQLGNGAGALGAGASIAVGTNPSSVAVGDLNHDGRLDAVVTNRFSSNNVMVLLGNGMGSFALNGTYAAGSGPWRAVISDVNRDGDLDVVVASRYSTDVRIFLGVGDGTLNTPIVQSTGLDQISLQVDDLNEDGQPDVSVAAFDTGTVRVLTANRICLP